MFDSQKVNGFVKQELDDLLFNDLWSFRVFNESDLKSACYFYLREYFRRRKSINSEEILVRCEPVLQNGKKPDIVIYHGYSPIYVLELKMFKNPEALMLDKVDIDLAKIRDFMRTNPTIRWGFQIVVYDSDDMIRASDSMLSRNGFPKISVIGLNLRRKEVSQRLRVGYSDWRNQFDKYVANHF